jgi:small subunit ribosomal protein S6
MTKKYELTYLISPDFSEQEANALSTEINSFIKETQGVLEKSLPLLKKQLSYSIKKKATAYLTSVNFQIKPDDLEKIKKQIESNPKILRYLIVTIIKEKLKTTPKSTKIPLIIKKTKKITPQKKVKLEEIEKKLEEIL